MGSFLGVTVSSSVIVFYSLDRVGFEKSSDTTIIIMQWWRMSVVFACPESILVLLILPWEPPFTCPSQSRTSDLKSLISVPEMARWPKPTGIFYYPNHSDLFWDRNQMGSVLVNTQILLELWGAVFFLQGWVGFFHQRGRVCLWMKSAQREMIPKHRKREWERGFDNIIYI